MPPLPAILRPALADSVLASRVIRLKDYDYFVHPLTDGVAPITPGLLREAVEGLRGILPTTFDTLLAPEAMGLPLAAGLAEATGRPFLVARKRPYGLPGEVEAPYRTGYSEGRFFLNGLVPGERVAIVDDVTSRGGTIRALAKALPRTGAHLTKVAVLFNKNLDLEALGQEIGAPVEALFNVEVRDGSVHILSRP